MRFPLSIDIDTGISIHHRKPHPLSECIRVARANSQEVTREVGMLVDRFSPEIRHVVLPKEASNSRLTAMTPNLVGKLKLDMTLEVRELGWRASTNPVPNPSWGRPAKSHIQHHRHLLESQEPLVFQPFYSVSRVTRVELRPREGFLTHLYQLPFYMNRCRATHPSPGETGDPALG